MNEQLKRVFFGALVVGGAILAVRDTRAMFVLLETENVPIDRLIATLEKRLAQDPQDVETRLNLGRLHAMAYASKSEMQPALSQNTRSGRPGDPYFGPMPGLQRVEDRPATDAAALAAARAHLPKAIEAYDAVLAINPANMIARIGRAWCQDRAGQKSEAVAAYRAIFEDAFKRESEGNLPTLANYLPSTVEVGQYLRPLLDPVNDADEIANITSRSAQIQSQMRSRPITPIVIPLVDRAAASTLIDRTARVPFDADGSGLVKRWTWITPDAGWLVFDRLDRRRMTSALQWFGGVTFWLFWQNGYHALRSLDDNDDGALAGDELTGLAIWRDENSNGVSESGEVRSVGAWGIVKLSWAHQVTDDPDLAAFSPAGVTFANGRTRPTYDVLLYPR